jgi:hypothetical protein
MTRELREVWVYTPPMAPHNLCVRLTPFDDLPDDFRQHVQRLPLLTDADRAVLEAAEEEECAFDLYKKAIERKEYQNDAAFELWQAAHIRYREAVRARRAARDHVADAGKKVGL